MQKRTSPNCYAFPPLQILLDAKADIDQGTKTDLTPCYLATQNDHSAIVELLISYGADVNKVCPFVCSRSIHTLRFVQSSACLLEERRSIQYAPCLLFVRVSFVNEY